MKGFRKVTENAENCEKFEVGARNKVIRRSVLLSKKNWKINS